MATGFRPCSRLSGGSLSSAARHRSHMQSRALNRSGTISTIGFPMHQTSARLIQVVEETEPRLSALTEPETETRSGSTKWSRKEILGHLIDSASNNHQRFVRAQLDGALNFPGY